MRNVIDRGNIPWVSDLGDRVVALVGVCPGRGPETRSLLGFGAKILNSVWCRETDRFVRDVGVGRDGYVRSNRVVSSRGHWWCFIQMSWRLNINYGVQGVLGGDVKDMVVLEGRLRSVLNIWIHQCICGFLWLLTVITYAYVTTITFNLKDVFIQFKLL